MTDYFVGDREYFPAIGKIPFEGPESDSPLAFRYYQPERTVGGKTMAEHLRFSVAYWHTFCGTGADPFGPGVRVYPWDEGSDPMQQARQRMDAAFEMFTKLGVQYYCFHDRDMAPEGKSIQESEANLSELVDKALERQQQTGMKLLWGTANVFSHPRYMNGAATNPEFDTLAQAGAQVKAALDATVKLGGENYVLWGGREGYATLLNTNTRLELENLARFLGAVRDYGREIGFTGNFLIEPKPMEPMRHQYDFDASTVIGFLRHHGLDRDFKLNVEGNHATLAGHTFEHELQTSADADMLGSIDGNRGNPQNGWDTDQFPMDLYETTTAMMVVLRAGGLAPGGINFDAKLRRESTDLDDIFLAHIGGMDAFARGLLVADELLNDSPLPAMREKRYESYSRGPGLDFREGRLGLRGLRDHAAQDADPPPRSGKQELLENLLNQYLLR